jgi:hypothetical protein
VFARRLPGQSRNSAGPGRSAGGRPWLAERVDWGGGPGLAIEVREGIRLGVIEGGRLVEVEEGIGVEGRHFSWRRAREGQRWRGGGKPEVAKNTNHGEKVGKEGEDAHLGAAVGAGEREILVALEQPVNQLDRRIGAHPVKIGGLIQGAISQLIQFPEKILGTKVSHTSALKMGLTLKARSSGGPSGPNQDPDHARSLPLARKRSRDY